MENYDFKRLADHLAIGQEIEFVYNNTEYSITCSGYDGYWLLYDDTTKTELLAICEFDDKKTLIKKVAEYEINGISIQEIFDSYKYDIETLWVL